MCACCMGLDSGEQAEASDLGRSEAVGTEYFVVRKIAQRTCVHGVWLFRSRATDMQLTYIHLRGFIIIHTFGACFVMFYCAQVRVNPPILRPRCQRCRHLRRHHLQLPQRRVCYRYRGENTRVMPLTCMCSSCLFEIERILLACSTRSSWPSFYRVLFLHQLKVICDSPLILTIFFVWTTNMQIGIDDQSGGVGDCQVLARQILYTHSMLVCAIFFKPWPLIRSFVE